MAVSEKGVQAWLGDAGQPVCGFRRDAQTCDQQWGKIEGMKQR
jgi:hypothetical protein